MLTSNIGRYVLTVTRSPCALAPSTCFAMSLMVPFKDSAKKRFMSALICLSESRIKERVEPAPHALIVISPFL